MNAFDHAYCQRPADEVVHRAAQIQMLVLDVDGVMTDGSVFVGEGGEPFKPFHIHDGKGIALLRQNGVRVAVITARESPAVRARAAELGIDPVCQGVRDKGARLQALAAAHGLPLTALAYVGDDLVDLRACGLAGLSVAVADAHPRLLATCHWRTRRPGGRGAVREVCELILAAREQLQAIFDDHA